jgi:hypothetical protein
MKKTSNQSREADSATHKLMIAHNEIIAAWFEHWNLQEQSRIDLAFKKSGAVRNGRRQVA